MSVGQAQEFNHPVASSCVWFQDRPGRVAIPVSIIFLDSSEEVGVYLRSIIMFVNLAGAMYVSNSMRTSNPVLLRVF